MSYSLGCFCDLPELPTNSAVATTATETTDTIYLATNTATTYNTDNTALTADTATTELQASSTVPTTSFAELATSSETTTAAATTTTAGFGCPDGFPSESSCGVFQEYTGGGNYIKDISGTYSVRECLQLCIGVDTCTLFSHGSNFCGLWNGDFSTNLISKDWSWYEFGCFCVERASVD
ncbi:hypothetical protein LB503_012607 [Fusarium chuoi]|nr:hypothetical protein LB503_012607 [Fusarium chuoi]